MGRECQGPRARFASGISPFLLDAMPYLLVIVVLAALGRRRRHAAPEELDRVFETSS